MEIRRWIPRWRTLTAALLAATALVVVRPAPASAAEWWETSSTAAWYDGQVSYSQVLNCFSVIQGSPYYEYGVGAYVGYLADPQSARPAAGDKGWIRYRVYGMGNPCPGGSYFRPKFYLPSGMAWDTSRQIACAYDGSGGFAPQANCPGWNYMDASNAYWNNGSGSGGNLWGVAQGHSWEFQLPVTMSQPLSGAVLDVHLDVADGNSNPQMLLRSNNIYVFNGAALDPVVVLYDQPSSYDAATRPWDPPGVPTQYGMLSQFQAVVDGRSFTAQVQLATDPTMSSLIGSESTGTISGYSSVPIATDWADVGVPLTPGTTYYWRGVVTPTSGSPTLGPIQSFVLASGGGVVESTVGGASGGGVGTGGGGTLGGTITPIPQPTAPPPTTAPTSPPPVAPAVTLKTPARVSVRKALVAKVTCAVACSGKVTVVVPKKLAGKLRLKSAVLGSRKVSLSAAGTGAVRITFSKAVRKAVGKVGKVKVKVRAEMSSGGQRFTPRRSMVVLR